MSDGVPKSRVTLTYDTRQPEGREKPRELPFRLLVLGDVGGAKDAPFDERKVRQLNGRNLGEVMKGLKIQIKDIELDDSGKRKVDVLVDSMGSFSPDSVLRLLTGQRRTDSVPALLKQSWGDNATAEELWPGDAHLTARWEKREDVVGFQKSYQNSKVLRTALKSFGTPPADETERQAREDAITDMKEKIEAKLKEQGIELTADSAEEAAGG